MASCSCGRRGHAVSGCPRPHLAAMACRCETARAGAPAKRCKQGHTGQYHGKQCALSDKQPIKRQKGVRGVRVKRVKSMQAYSRKSR